jgi:hypothetical protein
MNPRKRVMIPINLNERSTLSPADLKIPSVMVLKINTSPVKIHLNKAIAKAIMKNENQIRLRAMLIHLYRNHEIINYLPIQAIHSIFADQKTKLWHYRLE